MSERNLYSKLSMYDWLDDTRVPKATAEDNAALIKVFKEIDGKFGRNNCILYFLITEYGINDCRTMFASSTRQRKLVKAIIYALREKSVPKEYAREFKKTITSLNKRIDFVFKIIGENIRLTEYAPFFNTVGYELLTQLKLRSLEQDEQMKAIKEEALKYNEAHKLEIEAYMEAVKDEIAIRDAHRAKVKADAKAEKEARRQARRIENAEIKEMKKNAKKHASRERLIQQEINTTLRRIGSYRE